MEARGGCCIAKYPNGTVYDMSNVDKIMLKFRPIAPKPVPAVSPPESAEQASPKTGRGKRKYNKENKTNNKNKYNTSTRKKKASSVESEITRKTSSGDSMVTLSLLPETPERKESPAKERAQSPILLRFGARDNCGCGPLCVGHVSDQKPMVAPVPVRGPMSVVTVECVTDTWLDVQGFGLSDHQRMVNLARDKCPGFISNSLDQVLWSNMAYSEMIGGGGAEVSAWLVMKERVPIRCRAFSCRVKVQSMIRKEKQGMIVPCDVWRLDSGGLAWRLDLDAALSLGR